MVEPAPTVHHQTGQYFEDHPEKLPEPDSGRPVHALLLNFFAMQLWTRIWKDG
jgi:hypothetical protein